MSLDSVEQLIKDKMNESVNQLLLSDSGELLDQLQHIRLLGDWYKNLKEKGDGSMHLGDLMTTIKQTIAEQIASAASPEFKKGLFERLSSEAKNRLEKGFDIPALNLPTIKPDIIFEVMVNGVPIPNNLLKLMFEIIPVAEVKGVKADLEDDKRISIQSLAAHFKLYFLIPMMIGNKKIKIGEFSFNILKSMDVYLPT